MQDEIIFNKEGEQVHWITTDYGQYVEVVPSIDTREHHAGDECWCEPRTVRELLPRPVIVHSYKGDVA